MERPERTSTTRERVSQSCRPVTNPVSEVIFPSKIPFIIDFVKKSSAKSDAFSVFLSGFSLEFLNKINYKGDFGGENQLR